MQQKFYYKQLLLSHINISIGTKKNLYIISHFQSFLISDCPVKCCENCQPLLTSVGMSPSGDRVQQQAVYTGSTCRGQKLMVGMNHELLQLYHFSGEFETRMVKELVKQFMLN